VLWWLVSLVLAAYVTEGRDFGVTYGPLTGVMALLLWANLTGIAVFVGVAFAAQLEATRVGISGPAVAGHDKSLEERTKTHANQPQLMAALAIIDGTGLVNRDERRRLGNSIQVQNP
jgi:uncharacterized BrkB/YihY/UPF0761 family membrane protein